MAGEFIFTEPTLPPATCLFCSCNPVDETLPHKPQFPMAHAVGMDVNWGESVYVCVNCIGVMADFIGREDAEKVKNLREAYETQTEELEELKEKHHVQSQRIKRILEGKKAVAEQKAAA